MTNPLQFEEMGKEARIRRLEAENAKLRFTRSWTEEQIRDAMDKAAHRYHSNGRLFRFAVCGFLNALDKETPHD